MSNYEEWTAVKCDVLITSDLLLYWA